MKRATKQRQLPEFNSEGASIRLAAFIKDMKLLRVYEDVDWDSEAWDISASDKSARAHLRNKKRLIFVQHSKRHKSAGGNSPLLTPYADLVKSLIVRRYADRGMGPGTQCVFVRASRYLYDALPLPVRYDPTLITRGHFVSAEASALDREAASSAYRISVHLEELARSLDRHGLCRAAINFLATVPRKGDEFDRTTATFEKRSERLLSKSLIEALADIANDPRILDRPFDLLRIRIIELLLVGGFRVGEVLTLPADCIIREPEFDEAGDAKLDATTGVPVEKIAIRYWPEKGAEPIPKPIPTVANPLVLRAIEDIERLCSPARQNARWLETHPGEVDLRIPDRQELSASEAAELLGLAETSFDSWLRSRGGRALLKHRGRRPYITSFDLKRTIAVDRFDGPVLVKKNGRRQNLSQSLFVIYRNAAHSMKATNTFISLPMTWRHMADFLSGHGDKTTDSRSIFERFGKVDESGKPFSARTHDFRRLLNTIGQRGGLTQAEIALWMGRRRVDDNSAYDLRSAIEMAADLRKLVEANEVYGIIVDQVNALPEAEREAFLKDRLTMSHTTPLGRCASNVAENPCATALSCLAGCRHYLRRKGDAKSRIFLLRLERETVEQLERAEAVADKGNAANWIRGHEAVLRHTRAALAIDDDENLNEGDLRHVNPDGPVIGKPL